MNYYEQLESCASLPVEWEKTANFKPLATKSSTGPATPSKSTDTSYGGGNRGVTGRKPTTATTSVNSNKVAPVELIKHTSGTNVAQSTC